jgi:arylsulfatase A-like enzyme
MDTRPNILFVFPDQLGARWLPTYGNPTVQTPHLDAFADQSTVFERAITSSPVCTPYRGCLLTGRYPSQTGVLENGQALPEDATTFAHLLNDVGYDTHYIGKWHLSGDPQKNRWIPPEQRGGFQNFIGWESHHVDHNQGLIWNDNPDEVIKLEGHETDGLTNIAVRQLKKASQSDNPFCIVVSYQAPHPPCSPPDKFSALYDELDVFPELNADKTAYYDRPEWSADYGVETFRRLYYGEISQIDEAFGRILETLDELNLSDNTLVIFTSDHGEMAGAHGLFGKGVMYEEALHVPLMIRIPDQPLHKRVSFPASTVNFLPTLLDYAGCEPYASVEGSSLRPYIEGYAENHDSVTFSEYHNFCATTSDWKLFTDGRTLTASALYHIQDDPYELENRLNDPACADIQKYLIDELTNWYKNIVGETQL